MDPTATLIALLEAMEAHDASAALDATLNLGNWLAGNGFLPIVTVQHHAYKVVVSINTEDVRADI